MEDALRVNLGYSVEGVDHVVLILILMEDALREYIRIYYYSTRLYAATLTKPRQKLTAFNAIFCDCKGSDSDSYMKDLFSVRERANEHSSYTNILPFSQKKSVFLLWVITSTFMLCPIIFMDLSRSVDTGTTSMLSSLS